MNKRKWLTNFCLLLTMVMVCFMMSGYYSETCTNAKVTIDGTEYTGKVSVGFQDEDSTTFKGYIPSGGLDTLNGWPGVAVLSGSTVEIPVTIDITQGNPSVLAENYTVTVGGVSYPCTLTEINGTPYLTVSTNIPYTAGYEGTSKEIKVMGLYTTSEGEQVTFENVITLLSVDTLPCSGCSSFYENGYLIHQSCSACQGTCDGNGIAHAECSLCEAVCDGNGITHATCIECGNTCDGETTYHDIYCPMAMHTVYFENTEGWDTVYVFYWSQNSDEVGARPGVSVNPFSGKRNIEDVLVDYTSDLTEWPGLKMTDRGNGIWSAEIPDAANGLLFNNGSEVTGEILSGKDGKNFYTDGEWDYILKIVTQPADAAARNGEGIRTSVKAEGYGLKYQWMLQNTGDENWYLSDVKSRNYSITMTDKRADRKVYCVVTDAFGNQVISETATLERTPTKLEIVTQPSAETAVRQGETWKVTVEAKGDNLQYQWMLRNEGSDVFVESAIKNKHYSVTMTDKRANREIYCVITDAYGNQVTTDIVKLNRLPSPIEILKQPESVTVAMGKSAKVSVNAKGDGLKYQWYICNAGKDTFGPSAVTGKTYSITMTKARANRQVYCLITDAYGNTMQTDTVTLFCNN